MASSVFAEYPADEHLYEGEIFTCVSADLDVSEQKILDAYLAFYGRVVDVGGFEYWSDTVKERDGNLDVILNAFASSDEFNLRFGVMNETELVINLYQQMFDRMPEETGLEYYVNKLETGSGSLQSIALDIFNGAKNDDLMIRDNRRAFSEHYYKHVKTSNELGLAAEEATKLLSSISGEEGADDQACFDFMKRFPGTNQTTPVGEFRTVVLAWLYGHLHRLNLDKENQDFRFEYHSHHDDRYGSTQVKFNTYYKDLLVRWWVLRVNLHPYENDGHEIWYVDSIQQGNLLPITEMPTEPEITLEEITAIASDQYGVRVNELIAEPQLVLMYSPSWAIAPAWVFTEANTSDDSFDNDTIFIDNDSCEFVFNGLTGELISTNSFTINESPYSPDPCDRVSKLEISVPFGNQF